MNQIDGRDLDLNLLRVFVVTAEAGSVTSAAHRLYLTQPAVSAAMKRLATAVGAPLFARAGRGLALTTRGKQLLLTARPHLAALIDAALSPTVFSAETSERTVRAGLSDASESWLLPALLQALEVEAPRMRLIVLPVQFRNVAEALSTSLVDLAVTVADEMPAGIDRQTLFAGGFTCLFDPRHVRLKKTLSREQYFAHEHVVVSYNGDLRGVVEDALGMTRKVRISVPTFQSVGPILDGTRLLATVPALVAHEIRRLRPHLKTLPLPLALDTAPMELLTRSASRDDPALSFVTQLIARVAKQAASRLRLPR